jgi:hypothetical protein
MNAIKRFFQDDIPAVFSAGRWRVGLMQLKSRLSQLEKQKTAALTELGQKTWDSRVKDDRYSEPYGKLEEFDAQVVQIQQEIDAKQQEINHETDHLNATRLDFDNRLKSTQDQRQVAVQKLTQLQANQKNLESRLNQLRTNASQATTNVQNMQAQISQMQGANQPDNNEKIASLQSTISTMQTQIDEANSQIDVVKAEFEVNQAEQAPIKNEVDGYNQLINMLQAQSKSALDAIQANLKRLQQELLKVSERKSGVPNQMSALMPDLGNQVYRHRPTSDALTAAYTKVDGISSEIKGVNDQVNLTQARLASVDTRSVQKVAIAAGALVFLVVCIAAFAAFVVPNVTQALKPDPKRDVRLVQSWTLENCSTFGSNENYLDISVWENRRNDAIARANVDLKLLGANDIVLDSQMSTVQIAPDGMAVSLQEMDPKGSRVQEVRRSVSSAQFEETSFVQFKSIDVKPFFEKTRDSNNVALSLEITNNTDFGLESGDAAYAFVVNSQNEVIDMLIGSLNSVAVDALSTINFQSVNYFGSVSCFQSDYSQESVTFWYFVPLRATTNSDDRFTLSGKAEYAP